MKKRILLSAALVLAGAALWTGTHELGRHESANGHPDPRSRDLGDSADHSEEPGRLKTKSSIRELAGLQATHGPERLKEFFLPAVDIDGLTLAQALQKLMAAYEEACGKTGETPLRLTFNVPSGSIKKLHLKLGPRNFNSSIRILGTYAGMKVNRDKTVYRFEPIADERTEVKREFAVSPDFKSELGNQARLTSGNAGDAGPLRLSIDEILRSSGLELDPSTRLSLGPSGELKLETSSGADAAVISALADSLGRETPVQNKFTTKLIEIPSDLDWTPPDVSQLTDPELQLLMRNLAQKKGVDLMTMPSVTAKANQPANIEIIREFLYEKEDSPGVFESRNVGLEMHAQGSPLGFGHDISYDLSNTTAGVDPVTLKPVFTKNIDVSDSGFSSDLGTKFTVQERPDGSRILVLVTSTMIDATGRPVHGPE